MLIRHFTRAPLRTDVNNDVLQTYRVLFLVVTTLLRGCLVYICIYVLMDRQCVVFQKKVWFCLQFCVLRPARCLRNCVCHVSHKFIYLRKITLFTYELRHIFRYFLYRPYYSLHHCMRFIVQGNTTNRVHGDANANTFVESNRYLLTNNGSRNYRRTTTTDSSVGTDVVSSLLTAVVFLCFTTYNARLHAHT